MTEQALEIFGIPIIWLVVVLIAALIIATIMLWREQRASEQYKHIIDFDFEDA